MKKLISLFLALMLLCTPALASAETVVTSFYPIYLFALNLLHGIDCVLLLFWSHIIVEYDCLHVPGND